MERDRASAVYYKQQYHAILNQLSGPNLAVLTQVVVIPQMSWNKKISQKFLDAAFDKAGTEKYLGAILFYLEGQEPDVAKGAMKRLRAILQRKRDIVMNGGTSSSADQVWMSNPRLLRLLIKKTAGSVSPIAGFMSKVPAFPAKRLWVGPLCVWRSLRILPCPCCVRRPAWAMPMRPLRFSSFRMPGVPVSPSIPTVRGIVPLVVNKCLSANQDLGALPQLASLQAGGGESWPLARRAYASKRVMGLEE